MCGTEKARGQPGAGLGVLRGGLVAGPASVTAILLGGAPVGLAQAVFAVGLWRAIEDRPEDTRVRTFLPVRVRDPGPMQRNVRSGFASQLPTMIVKWRPVTPSTG